MLWLEEIRQGVVRANQDTDAAQRSTWAWGPRRRQGRAGGGGDVGSPLTPSPFQPLWGGGPETEQGLAAWPGR